MKNWEEINTVTYNVIGSNVFWHVTWTSNILSPLLISGHPGGFWILFTAAVHLITKYYMM